MYASLRSSSFDQTDCCWHYGNSAGLFGLHFNSGILLVEIYTKKIAFLLGSSSNHNENAEDRRRLKNEFIFYFKIS